MNRPQTNLSRVSRQNMLVLTGGAFASLLALGGLPVAALATPADVQKWLAEQLPGTPKPGKVTIGAPDIAENGNTVPITLTVDSPMTAQNYVKSIVVAADGNPLPGVAKFDLTPANAQANVQFRIRLAQTQNIYAVALMSDGSLWSAQKAIKVTIGGCGG
jgi:sulfur-oxidizing protein SoxY